MSQRHRYKTHNNIKNKQEQMGPWLHPTRVWEDIIRLKFRVILLVGVTQVRWDEGIHTNYFHG